MLDPRCTVAKLGKLGMSLTVRLSREGLDRRARDDAEVEGMKARDDVEHLSVEVLYFPAYAVKDTTAHLPAWLSRELDRSFASAEETLVLMRASAHFNPVKMKSCSASQLSSAFVGALESFIAQARRRGYSRLALLSSTPCTREGGVEYNPLSDRNFGTTGHRTRDLAPYLSRCVLAVPLSLRHLPEAPAARSLVRQRRNECTRSIRSHAPRMCRCSICGHWRWDAPPSRPERTTATSTTVRPACLTSSGCSCCGWRAPWPA